jgi:hypothetical protein
VSFCELFNGGSPLFWLTSSKSLINLSNGRWEILPFDTLSNLPREIVS